MKKRQMVKKIIVDGTKISVELFDKKDYMSLTDVYKKNGKPNV